ncbi:ATP-grasp domain-containing protein [Allobranchiibius huperziae]|uniref:Glutathione synthase/RimK-type ligase-like ATP-grasp enzyme n=1 Tax=Allobranchiibius huperziae TaxID=1874116 RepID=A0A853D802_9MICO|nr:hypothetical protein [Allobranchiibius huperziae]NYJ73078.1 glutathione synthase/RimK-type ligase-like ATP-grasp enzyme [Allobranchiibius huperziae]
MATITLLTSAAARDRENSEITLLSKSLTQLGVATRTASWTDTDAAELGAGDIAIIRTTWDYTSRVAEFLAFVDALPVVHNPAEVIRWNSHKGYLVELAGAGVPVVPTVLVRSVDGLDPATILESARGAFTTSDIIVKPAVAASARGMGRFALDSSLDLSRAIDHVRGLSDEGDVLVQPFQPDIADGERSLIFFAGQFAHAMLKTPAPDDFRVQARWGGTSVAYMPTDPELEAAHAAAAAAPGGAKSLLYARVDLVGPASAPSVMELELVEPDLFLSSGAGNADAFAQAIAGLVAS